MVLYKLPGEGSHYFSEAEDELLLNLFKMHNGSEKLASEQASIELNLPPKNVRTRLYSLLKRKPVKANGLYTLEEDDAMLRYFFVTKQVPCSVDGINPTRRKMEFNELSTSIGRSVQSVYKRWRGFLKPLLLSYHYGCLHMSWKKDLYQFAIKEKAVGVQCLKIEDIQAKWPFLTVDAVYSALTFVNKKSKDCQPLWKNLQDNFDKINDRHSTWKSLKKRREDIASLYAKIIDEKERASKV